MADNDSVAFHQQLLSIDENLGKDDVEDLKFLCSDFITLKKLETVKSAQDIFLFLINEDLINKDDTFLIAELLYIIGCNFLLSKLGYTKEIVEEELRERRKISGYRQLLYEITQDLAMDNVKNAAFLLKDHLPKKQPIRSALELLASLEKKNLLMESNLDILKYICEKTAPHLLKKIEMYKQEKVPHQGIEETVPSSVRAFNKPTFGNISLQDPVLPKTHARFPSMNANTLQMSLPKLSLADPPEPMNKERVMNGACAVQAEQIHISIPETEVQGCNKYRMQSKPLGVCLIIGCIGRVCIRIRLTRVPLLFLLLWLAF